MSDAMTLVAQLPTMKLDALRTMWRERFGEPPALRSTDLMRRALAERLQMGEEGGALDRRLARAVAQHRTGCKPTLRTARFKAGSTLQREWKGQRHQVEVTTDGYRWNDRDWKSLSSIAREITNSRWNGPRFFGLRQEIA